MKTKYKFIHFTQTNGKNWTCWTNAPRPIGSGGVFLGEVEPYPKRHQWQFVPVGGTAYTGDCLADIAHFMAQLLKP